MSHMINLQHNKNSHWRFVIKQYMIFLKGLAFFYNLQKMISGLTLRIMLPIWLQGLQSYFEIVHLCHLSKDKAMQMGEMSRQMECKSWPLLICWPNWVKSPQSIPLKKCQGYIVTLSHGTLLDKLLEWSDYNFWNGVYVA